MITGARAGGLFRPPVDLFLAPSELLSLGVFSLVSLEECYSKLSALSQAVKYSLRGKPRGRERERECLVRISNESSKCCFSIIEVFEDRIAARCSP